MSDEFLTVSELNNFIRDVLKSGFPGAVWVCGEIQGYDRGKDKKHIFFELCEKDAATQDITARIGLVIFAPVRPKIDAILKKGENAFELKDDIEVKFLCKVDFYPGHGQVRLIVESIDPVYTLGKIAQDRQRLIALLKQKGILEMNKRLEMPLVILNVGLITSYDSAAYHDFISELRNSGYAFRVYICNAVMQGKNTQSSVIKALMDLQRILEVDVIVITRGGGSIAELSCFDSEKIVTAIAQSGVPVLSAIGHEINTTVTDLAAHTFAKTPTAIARFLVERLEEFLRGIDLRQEKIMQGALGVLEEGRSRLKDRSTVLQTRTLGLITSHHQRLAGIMENLKRGPASLIKETRKSLEDKKINLNKIIYLHLQKSRTKINQYQKLAELADPQNILKRGFSVTRSHEGNLIRRVNDAKGVKGMTTQLVDGVVHSILKEV
ncbi:MAG: exodeoxyribonuclease VII large subunit [Candidatus Omnitrophica bacterium]|nr:exodeoxyribonuclease VII large subunit [Candidatus Omnitrophota bacterium]